MAVAPGDVDLDGAGAGVLLGVHHRLADHRPGGELERRVEPAAGDADPQRHGGVPGHVVEGGGQPAVLERGRVQPVGEVAQLADRGLGGVGARRPAPAASARGRR